MSDFKAKMFQIQFPSLGELTALPRPLAALRGPTSNGRGGDETPPLHAPLSHISGYAPSVQQKSAAKNLAEFLGPLFCRTRDLSSNQQCQSIDQR